jgi:hypothetical protein
LVYVTANLLPSQELGSLRTTGLGKSFLNKHNALLVRWGYKSAVA